MQYEVKQGQSIYDVAVLLYGDAQQSVRLCVDNNISISADITGLVLEYEANVKAQNITNNNVLTLVQVPPDEAYVIKQQQSNYDLCLHYGYTLDRYADFINDSALPASEVNNVGAEIVVTRQNNNLISYTFATLYDYEQPITQGIGWMTIGTTFIVG